MCDLVATFVAPTSDTSRHTRRWSLLVAVGRCWSRLSSLLRDRHDRSRGRLHPQLDVATCVAPTAIRVSLTRTGPTRRRLAETDAEGVLRTGGACRMTARRGDAMDVKEALRNAIQDSWTTVSARDCRPTGPVARKTTSARVCRSTNSVGRHSHAAANGPNPLVAAYTAPRIKVSEHSVGKGLPTYDRVAELQQTTVSARVCRPTGPVARKHHVGKGLPTYGSGRPETPRRQGIADLRLWSPGTLRTA